MPNQNYDPYNNGYQNNQYNGQQYGQQFQNQANQYGNQQYANQGQYGQNQYGQNQYNQNPYANQGQVNMNGQPMNATSQFGNPYGNTYGQSIEAMNQTNRQASPLAGVGNVLAAVDMNSIITKSFLFMFLGLLVTGIVSVATASAGSALFDIFWGSGSSIPLIICIVLEFALVFAATGAMNANNVGLSAFLFFAYAAVNGFTLSVIFLVYSASSIASTFLVTAVLFGIMAAIGALTKTDLTSIGKLLMMGLFGIIIASLVNMFIGSGPLDYLISIVGIAVFMGLTAYDMQKIKRLASGHTGYSTNVIGLWGAMELYLDFVNLFLKLLRIFGKKR